MVHPLVDIIYIVDGNECAGWLSSLSCSGDLEVHSTHIEHVGLHQQSLEMQQAPRRKAQGRRFGKTNKCLCWRADNPEKLRWCPCRYLRVDLAKPRIYQARPSVVSQPAQREA
jgi:hypothetical protein